jgi:hypothetical protein
MIRWSMMNWKEFERTRSCPQIIARHLPGGTEKHYVNFGHDSWCAGRDSNSATATKDSSWKMWHWGSVFFLIRVFLCSHYSSNATSRSYRTGPKWLSLAALLQLTNKLNSMGPIFLEKPLVARLLKKFPVFYGTPRFINVFTKTRQWSLCWEKLLQSYRPILVP